MLIEHHHAPGHGGWIRAFGLLLHWKHRSNPPLFTERNGYKKYYRVGFGWRVRLSKGKPYG